MIESNKLRPLEINGSVSVLALPQLAQQIGIVATDA